MPVPVDPGDFGFHAPITSSGQNLRFQRLYKTLDPAQIGIDDSNIKPLGIGTPSLAAKAVTAAKVEDQQAWQDLPFSVSGLAGTLKYFKDSLGIVRVRGDLFTASGAVSSGPLVAFPVGYRPGSTQAFPLFLASTCFRLTVAADGTITVTGFASGNVICFSGIEFRAEN